MTDTPTEPTPTDEMVERVAAASADADILTDGWEHMIDSERDDYRRMARAAITALAPELNRADLTGRAVAIKVRDAKENGRDVTNDEVTEAINDPARVVMKR